MEMEQEKERRQGMHELVVRVAILEDRMERVQTDMKTLADRVEVAVSHIEKSISEIKDRPNAVTEFLDKNWKALVVVGAALMGANATVVDLLKQMMIGG